MQKHGSDVCVRIEGRDWRRFMKQNYMTLLTYCLGHFEMMDFYDLQEISNGNRWEEFSGVRGY